MDGFASGIGLLILVLVLLFTWLAVAVFVSPDLAAAMGILVVGLWVVVFVPLGFFRELLWQGRQKQIMDAALKGTPAPYQPGSALPPPGAGSAASGGASGGALTVMPQPGPGAGGAIDLYRELPQLPKLETRPHASAFKKSLILPFVGLFMFFGAQNETVLHALLEARGLTQKMAVNWEAIKLPSEYADHQGDMNRAARLVLRREPECGNIYGGRLAALRQFTSPADQAEQIANEQFVYEFDCAGVGSKPQPYLAWVTPDDLGQSSFSAILTFFSSAPPDDKARQECLAAANKALIPLQSSVTAIIEPAVTRARSPSADSLRLYGNYRLTRSSGDGGLIGMSCWVGLKTPASVRFTRPGAAVP